MLGEGSIAAPVFDSWGEAVGAIGVVLPTGGPAVAGDVGAAVRDAARTISRELGAPGWPVAQAL